MSSNRVGVQVSKSIAVDTNLVIYHSGKLLSVRKILDLMGTLCLILFHVQPNERFSFVWQMLSPPW